MEPFAIGILSRVTANATVPTSVMPWQSYGNMLHFLCLLGIELVYSFTFVGQSLDA